MPDLHEPLRSLGVSHLVLVVHDSAFPAESKGDLGRGSPYSNASRRLFRFARSLGFTGIQFGPQGETSAENASPYDGCVFSKAFLSIALEPLCLDARWGGILDIDVFRAACRSGSQGAGGVCHATAYRSQLGLLEHAFAAFRARASELDSLHRSFATFRTRAGEWLERDARSFARRGRDPEFHAFVQFVLDEQHRELRGFARAMPLSLLGDLQIGIPPQDEQSFGHLFLDGYRLGAPPSRTNPAGQPWGYPVFGPAERTGAVHAFLESRYEKMFADFDGLRVDHPHGLVDPWVYRSDVSDPFVAVRSGARLYASPDLADHPELAQWSIARPGQLDRALPRYADGWVRELDAEQIDRYAALVDLLVRVGKRGGSIIPEVLSTCPFPLQRVLKRHALGRFRVTQKARPGDPSDAYASGSAAPEDWIMLGNHDTAPIWSLVESWTESSMRAEWARDLSTRLGPTEDLMRDTGAFVHAMFADVLASPARSVSVFFADLFGMTEVYNRPGTIDSQNWTLRIPSDFERLYAERVARGVALDVSRAVEIAIRARQLNLQDR